VALPDVEPEVEDDIPPVMPPVVPLLVDDIPPVMPPVVPLVVVPPVVPELLGLCPLVPREAAVLEAPDIEAELAAADVLPVEEPATRETVLAAQAVKANRDATANERNIVDAPPIVTESVGRTVAG